MIDNLLKSLADRKQSDTVFNQYRDEDILNNLKLYLNYLFINGSDTLLIGEAPGYKGCKLTGIPFTSGQIIEELRHSSFIQIAESIKLHEVASENTASFFWQSLEGISPIPILWNVFPFHPFDKGNPCSNRKPNAEEIREGKEYIELIYNAFKPKRLFSIGRVGEKALKELYPHHTAPYIRHPSYGGRSAFKAGMEMIKHRK